MLNKYYILSGVKELVLTENFLDSLNDNFVRVKILFCGICGSDKNAFYGRKKIVYPITIGHEICGEIMKKGALVKEFNVGDFITSDFNYRCQKCHFCLTSRSHLCDNNSLSLMSNRGYARFIDIHYKYLYQIPKKEKAYRYTLSEPLSCVLHALDKIDWKNINSIYINGLGSIGTLFCFALNKKVKNNNIFVNDVITKKLNNICKVFKYNSINQNQKEKFSLVIECTSTPKGLKQALTRTEKGGTVCIMSHLHFNEYIGKMSDEITRRDIKMIFPYLNGENIVEAIDMINLYWNNQMDEQFLEIVPFNDLSKYLTNKESLPKNKQILLCS